MPEDAQNTEHAAVDELLPWYVNDTLAAGERTRVRRHLDDCALCRENVSLLRRVISVVGRPAATPILPPRRPDALLERIDRLERAGARPSGRSATGRSATATTAVAASFAVAVAALLLLWPDRQADVPGPPVYETLTSDSQDSMDYVMKLEFEPGVGREDRQRILRELEAGDIRRDETSGAYHLNIALAAASLEELERFTSAVEARPEVRSARFVALQLPVQRRSEGRP